MIQRSSFILVALAFIVLFFAGFRWGRYVGEKNATFVPTPTPLLKPTTTPPPQFEKISFKVYENTTCGIRFIIPDNFKQTQNSSNSAQLTYGNQHVAFSCDQQKVQAAQKTFSPNEEVTTERINNQKIKIYKRESGNMEFILYRTLGKSVFFTTSNNLLLLIVKTIETIR